MQGNEAILKEALFKFKELIDEHDIEFVLLYGALLGAYRNKRLLPWDVDIDIAAVFNSYEELAETDIFGLLRDAYKEGFTNVRWAHEFIVDTDYIKYPEIRRMDGEKRWKEFLRIDPNWRNERFGMQWCNVTIDCLISVKGIHENYDLLRLEKLGEIELYGKIFNTPPDIELYLLEYYGKTWRNVFCSYELWNKHREELFEGRIPQEVENFMNKWRPLLDEE